MRFSGSPVLRFSGSPWLLYWIAAAAFVRKTASSESIPARSRHLAFLFFGFTLIINPHVMGLHQHSLALGKPVEIIGTAITAAGLLFAVWARNHLGRYWSGMITLKEDHRLIRTGPYRFARHPIYTGILFGVLGTALTSQSVEAFVGVVIIAGAFLIKIRKEESLLQRQFGEEYAKFRSEVKMLIPFLI